MTKENSEVTRREHAIVLAAALLGGTWGLAMTAALPALEEQQRREAIRSAPIDLLKGDKTLPDIDEARLATILATDPGARERWEEVKARMRRIEDMATRKTDLGAKTAEELRETFRKRVANWGR